MTYRMAFLSAAAVCIAALPHAAAAADYYDEGRAAGFERGPGGGDADVERFDRGPGIRPADRRAPGPVVFDERDPDRFRGTGGFHRGGLVDEDGGPVPFGAPAFGGGRFAGPQGGYGWPARPLPGYRVVAVPRDAFDGRPDRPDAGCTTEQAESVTPAGWRKIVTYRTCYRR